MNNYTGQSSSSRLPGCLCVCVSSVEQQWSECYQQLCWASAGWLCLLWTSPHFCLLSYKKPPDNNTATLNAMLFCQCSKGTTCEVERYTDFYFIHIYFHIPGVSFSPLLSVGLKGIILVSYSVHSIHGSRALTGIKFYTIFMATGGWFLSIWVTSWPSITISSNFPLDRHFYTRQYISWIPFKFAVDIHGIQG